MRLQVVEPVNLPNAWPELRDRVAACCARSGGKYEPIDILQNLLTGRMQLWLARERDIAHALAITEVVAYPRVTVCKLLACTGEEAHRWIDLIAGIEAWAKGQGCSALEPICRPGWERQLKPMGYRKTHVVLEKRL